MRPTSYRGRCETCGDKFFSDTPKEIINLHKNNCPYAYLHRKIDWK